MPINSVMMAIFITMILGFFGCLPKLGASSPEVGKEAARKYFIERKRVMELEEKIKEIIKKQTNRKGGKK